VKDSIKDMTGSSLLEEAFNRGAFAKKERGGREEREERFRLLFSAFFAALLRELRGQTLSRLSDRTVY